MWTNVCVEGYCFGDEKNGKYPCGRNVPSPFCMGNGQTGRCPHFAWSDTTERNAAKFVPIRLILKDKIVMWSYEVWSHLEWWFWGQLWFNRRKMGEFFKSIKVATAENNPCVAEWEAEQKANQEEFKVWFKEAKKVW